MHVSWGCITGGNDMAKQGDFKDIFIDTAENISDCKLKIYEKYGHGAFEEAKDFNDLVLKFLV